MSTVLAKRAAGLRRLAAESITEAQRLEQEADIAPTGPAIAERGHLYRVSKILPMLGLDEYEVRGAIESGKLKASKIEGRTYLSGAAIGEWLALRRK